MEKLNLLRNSNRIAYLFMLGFFMMSFGFFMIALILSIMKKDTHDVFLSTFFCFGAGVVTMFVHGHFFTLIKQTKNHLRSMGCDPGEADYEGGYGAENSLKMFKILFCSIHESVNGVFLFVCACRPLS